MLWRLCLLELYTCLTVNLLPGRKPSKNLFFVQDASTEVSCILHTSTVSRRLYLGEWAPVSLLAFEFTRSADQGRRRCSWHTWVSASLAPRF